MNKILFVGSLSQELNVVKEEIKKLELRNIKTSFLTTGMGNYNMILNLTRFLENHEFDLVINIGVCGYINLEDANSIIHVGRIKNLANNKELIIPKIINYGKFDSILCSEKVIFDENELEDESFVDMESYGFEKVCDSFSIPRIILKVPVDKVGKETKNFDFKKAELNLRNNVNYKELFEKINDHLDNHFDIGKGKYKVHHDILESYNNKMNFTFSENEKFKRLFYRYISLVNKDFNIYYDEHKNEKKKEFIKKLESFLEGYLVR